MTTLGHEVQALRSAEESSVCLGQALDPGPFFEVCFLYGFRGIINPSLTNPLIFKLEITIAFPVKFLLKN